MLLTGIGTALGEFFTIMTSGFTTFAPGFGQGLSQFAQNAFFEVSTEGAITGLNAFGGLCAMGLGVALTMSAGYLVFNIINR